jgi:hypothetical protein
MKECFISELLLERYRRGEVSRREQRLVKAALGADPSVRGMLVEPDTPDQELRSLIAAGKLLPADKPPEYSAAIRAFLQQSGPSRPRRRNLLVWGLAAGALISMLFPAFHLWYRSQSRPKEIAAAGKIFLSANNPAGAEAPGYGPPDVPEEGERAPWAAFPGGTGWNSSLRPQRNGQNPALFLGAGVPSAARLEKAEIYE